MLKVNEVSAGYGPVRALHGVTMAVDEGQIVALLGANGAGKTSTLRVISGLLRPSSGSVTFTDRPIHRWPPETIVAAGVCHVPEGRELFSELTVEENLRLGAYARKGRKEIRRDMDRVFRYFPILDERRKLHANSLSGGEQQMLAIARGLMSRPRILLLDEPSLGLAPLIVREIFNIIRTINHEEKVTILLVEQNANMALSIASYAYVLETGRIVLADTGPSLRENEMVRRSYLGY